MKLLKIVSFCALIPLLHSCSSSRRTTSAGKDSEIISHVKLKGNVAAKKIDTKEVRADDLVVFAESLQGVPYQYGSADIKKGFDCSGFITYVFNHFNISVPRTSASFTNAGMEVSIKESMPGDLILFTGSDPNSGVVGHMGIITKNKNNNVSFIHSASGGGKGVMISGMSAYFINRFVKVIRVFRINTM